MKEAVEELREEAVRLRHEADHATISAIADVLRSIARQYEALADAAQVEIGEAGDPSYIPRHGRQARA